MRNRSWDTRICSSASLRSVMSWHTPITRTGLPDSSRSMRAWLCTVRTAPSGRTMRNWFS